MLYPRIILMVYRILMILIPLVTDALKLIHHRLNQRPNLRLALDEL